MGRDVCGELKRAEKIRRLLELKAHSSAEVQTSSCRTRNRTILNRRWIPAVCTWSSLHCNGNTSTESFKNISSVLFHGFQRRLSVIKAVCFCHTHGSW